MASVPGETEANDDNDRDKASIKQSDIRIGEYLKTSGVKIVWLSIGFYNFS